MAGRGGEPSASSQKPLKIGISTKSSNLGYVNFNNKNMTNNVSLRLYRVQNMYYYRRTINKYTYRISLKTKNLQEAKLKKNELNLLKNEEFVKVFKEKVSKVYKATKKYFEVQAVIDGKVYKLSDEDNLKEVEKKESKEDRETNIASEEKIDIFENFDTYYNNFIEHRINFDKVSPSSVRTSNSAIRYLKFFIDKDTIFNFSFFKEIQKKLQQLPKNFFMYDKYYTKSYEEVLKLKKIENYETLNNKTINNHMNKYAIFFDYLVYEEIIKENPMDNIKSLQESKEIIKEEYTQEDLDKIFSSEIIEKDYLNMCKFALYTGLRLEEVLSIKKENIKDNLIHVTLKDTSHKNHTRIVPIHKNLIDIINQQQTNKGDYLFFNGNTENEVKNIGKKLNRRLKSIVDSKFKTFHSFRKNFSQELELNTNAEEKTKKYLMGHSMSKDVTHTDYNRSKMNISKLVDCINQITFKF